MAGTRWLSNATDGFRHRINFATLKATHGVAGQEGLAEHWAREAPQMRDCGIPLVGGCHRLMPGNPRDQVEIYLEAVQRQLGSYEGRIVQLDAEAADPATTREWLAYFAEITNHYPVAGYLPDWREGTWPSSDLAAYDFGGGWWASEYVPDPGSGGLIELYNAITAAQWHSWDGVAPTILQFSSQATIPGVPGTCDVNVYRGTLPELKAKLTR